MNFIDKAIKAISPERALKREVAKKRLSMINSGYGNYGASATRGEDYDLFYTDGVLRLERIESGKIKADNARLNIKFNSVDPSKVTKKEIIGGYDTNTNKSKIYEMILYGNPQLKDFPKTERYVLAGDIRKTMYTMLEMAVRLEKKYHKKTTLQDLDIEVDVLRNLLRLAKDPNLYPNQKPCLNFHTWEVWMRKVDEIGRMIGGYSEWVNGRERQK